MVPTARKKMEEAYTDICNEFDVVVEVLQDHANKVVLILDELRFFVDNDSAPGFSDVDPLFPNITSVKPNFIALVDHFEEYRHLREAKREMKRTIERLKQMERDDEDSDT